MYRGRPFRAASVEERILHHPDDLGADRLIGRSGQQRLADRPIRRGHSVLGQVPGDDRGTTRPDRSSAPSRRLVRKVVPGDERDADRREIARATRLSTASTGSSDGSRRSGRSTQLDTRRPATYETCSTPGVPASRVLQRRRSAALASGAVAPPAVLTVASRMRLVSNPTSRLSLQRQRSAGESGARQQQNRKRQLQDDQPVRQPRPALAPRPVRRP